MNREYKKRSHGDAKTLLKNGKIAKAITGQK
jgi:hypothetical protein